LILYPRRFLKGEIFEPLKNIQKFKSFKVDPILETIGWENGADLAPEIPIRKHENYRVTDHHSGILQPVLLN
jgi:hypothetical protein